MTTTGGETASRSGSAMIGVLAMAGATLTFPIGDTLSKLVVATGVSPVEVTLWRLVSQVACLGLVTLALPGWRRGGMFSPIVAASGLCMLVVLLGLVIAFAVMPIATAIAIFFVGPLILTLLSRPFLGEKVGPRRYAAVAVGMIGALIVIRPGLAVYGWPTLAPVVAATGFAVFGILTRKATRTRSSLTLQTGASIYATGFAAIGMILAALLGGPGITIGQAPAWAPLAMLGAGALASTSFFLVAVAYAHAQASALAPLQYLEIVGATIMGYLVFGDFPDGLTWVGTAIIVAAGAYVVYRERKASGPA